MQRRNNTIQLEQFYTNPDLARYLSNLVKNQSWFETISIVIEPSAGTGSFSNNFDNCKSYDIEPKHPSIKKADFLTLNFDNYFNNETVLAVGNPPFGRQSTLAFKFLKKCCEFADYIAFILPLSFVKQSYQDKIPLTHTLIYSEILPEHSFHNEETALRVPCVFQIYKRESRLKRIKTKTPPFLSLVNKNDNPNLAFVRAGGNAGTLKTENINSLSDATHYFIKTQHFDEVFENLSKIDWSKYFMTIGPRSISQEEFFQECWNFPIKTVYTVDEYDIISL